jgi:hypothetical protein
MTSIGTRSLRIRAPAAGIRSAANGGSVSAGQVAAILQSILEIATGDYAKMDRQTSRHVRKTTTPDIRMSLDCLVLHGRTRGARVTSSCRPTRARTQAGVKQVS